MPPKKVSKASQSDSDSGATLIVPGIYLGPRSSATPFGPFLTKNPQITHVLSIGSSPPEALSNKTQGSTPQKSKKNDKRPSDALRYPPPTQPTVIYHRLPLNDDPDSDIIPTVNQSVRIIEEVLYVSSQVSTSAVYPEDHTDQHDSNAGRVTVSAVDVGAVTPPRNKPDPRSQAPIGAVLIHCSAAISRSPTILAAYLMLSPSHQLSLRDALGLIIRSRPSVCPNPGFIKQLKAIEEGKLNKRDQEPDDIRDRHTDTETLADDHGAEALPDELPRGRKERLNLFRVRA